MNVFLNNSFSAVSYTLTDLVARWRHGPLRVVLSHSQEDPYLEAVADHFEIEPQDLDDQAYVEYCLEICRRHSIDVMVPRKRVNILARAAERFRELGVEVMWVADADIYDLLDDKLATLRNVESHGIVAVPDSYLVSDYRSFSEAYDRIRAAGDRACIKPNIGIGGKGFKVIKHHRTEIMDALQPGSMSISWTLLDRVLREAGSFSPVLMSTYLRGKEYSVDCLGHNGQLVAGAPRIYVNKHFQRIDDCPELLELSRVLTEHFGLSYLFNTQFRRHRGVWHLLEINTRMAAGMHRIQKVGFNFLQQALEMSMGLPITPSEEPRWGTQIFKRISYELGP
jgi:hypothetical protein